MHGKSTHRLPILVCVSLFKVLRQRLHLGIVVRETLPPLARPVPIQVGLLHGPGFEGGLCRVRALSDQELCQSDYLEVKLDYFTSLSSCRALTRGWPCELLCLMTQL